jgi:hypothetical protein
VCRRKKTASKQLLNVLGAIRKKYIELKAYYLENVNEVERICVISPKEWQKLYNSLLKQGENKILKEI